MTPEELEEFEFRFRLEREKEDTEPSQLGAAARSFGQGLTFGFGEELTSAAQAPFSEKTYEELRDEKRRQLRRDVEEYPKTAIAGEVAGAVLPAVASTMMSGGTAAPASAGRLATIGRSLIAPQTAGELAAAGGLYGLGKSESDLMKGEIIPAAKDVAMNAALGYGAGKALPVVGQKATELADYLGQKFGGAAEYFGGKAVGLTKGVQKKYKLTPEDTSAVGRQAIETGVISPLAGSTEMGKRASLLRESTGSQIGDIVEGLDRAGANTVNVQGMIADLNTAADRYAGLEGAAPIYEQYQKAIRDIATISNNPTLSELARLKKTYKDIAFPKGVPSGENRQGFIDAYHTLKRELEDAIGDAVTQLDNPAVPGNLVDKYKALKDTYGASKAMEKGLAERVTSEHGNRYIGLTDFGVTGAVGIGTGSLPIAIGSLAAKRAADRYGLQTTAIGLDKISKIIQSAPQTLGKYAPILQQAISRGSQSFSSTHFLLQQKDPEYRQMLQKISNNPMMQEYSNNVQQDVPLGTMGE